MYSAGMLSTTVGLCSERLQTGGSGRGRRRSADITVLACQPRLFSPVASDSTLYRRIRGIPRRCSMVCGHFSRAISVYAAT